MVVEILRCDFPIFGEVLRWAAYPWSTLRLNKIPNKAIKAALEELAILLINIATVCL